MAIQPSICNRFGVIYGADEILWNSWCSNGLAVISSDQLPHPKAAKGSILSVYRNGDDLAYDLQVEEDGIFVVADTYTKHWKAWINEKPSKIRVVNYAFKGVKISKGRVHLRFKYR